VIRQQLPALLVVVPLLAALLTPLVAWPWPRLAWPLAVAGAALTAATAGAGLLAVLDAGALRYAVGGWPPPWGIELILDPLSAFVAAVVAAVFACSAIFAAGLRDPRTRDRHGVTATLALLLLTGLMGIVLTGDLFNLFVFLEVSASPPTPDRRRVPRPLARSAT
jgi:multicomponent Na+:H+ antiporter subunit D